MKKTILFTLIAGLITWNACNQSSENGTDEKSETTESTESEEKPDPNIDVKGVGKFTSVELTTPLNTDWVKHGEEVSNMKCMSCHKITAEKIVGPGWQGVTQRRKPEWILNFITNTDEMIDKSPEAQKMLEICLTRMPNQNLSDDDARAVLEFMRHNDGEK